MHDETRPALTAKILLEVNDPANCDKVLPDRGEVAGRFVYGTHYCSVDNRENATAVACGSINSGIRVFDVRNPRRPVEIAYFNPPKPPAPPSAARDPVMSNLRSTAVDSCMTRIDFDFARASWCRPARRPAWWISNSRPASGRSPDLRRQCNRTIEPVTGGARRARLEN